jgi:hypothetical protein
MPRFRQDTVSRMLSAANSGAKAAEMLTEPKQLLACSSMPSAAANSGSGDGARRADAGGAGARVDYDAEPSEVWRRSGRAAERARAAAPVVHEAERSELSHQRR